MRKFLPILILLLISVQPTEVTTRPMIQIAEADRQQNWVDEQDEGSCVHASLVMLFRYQGQFEWADYWRQTYKGGENHDTLIEKLEENGIPYATTYGEGNVEFLEWAIRTKRGCMVVTGRPNKKGRIRWGNHMIVLVHLDSAEAAIIDPNRPDVITWMDRNKFISEWIKSRSWATTVISED